MTAHDIDPPDSQRVGAPPPPPPFPPGRWVTGTGKVFMGTAEYREFRQLPWWRRLLGIDGPIRKARLKREELEARAEWDPVVRQRLNGGDAERTRVHDFYTPLPDVSGIPHRRVGESFDEPPLVSPGEPIDEAMRRADSAARQTLRRLGYTWCGGPEWKPPLGKAPDFESIDRRRALLADCRNLTEFVPETPNHVARQWIGEAAAVLQGFVMLYHPEEYMRPDNMPRPTPEPATPPEGEHVNIEIRVDDVVAWMIDDIARQADVTRDQAASVLAVLGLRALKSIAAGESWGAPEKFYGAKKNEHASLSKRTHPARPRGGA